MYLELFSELILDVPVQRENGLWSHDDVVKYLDEITVSWDNSIGIDGSGFKPGSFSQFLVFSFKCQPSTYELVIKLFKDILFSAQFTNKRIIVAIKKLLRRAKKSQRDASKVLSSMINTINYSKASNRHTSQSVVQMNFLQNQMKALQSKNHKTKNNLNLLLKELVKPQNIYLQVFTNVEEGNIDLVAPWKQLFPESTSNLSDKLPQFSSVYLRDVPEKFYITD